MPNVSLSELLQPDCSVDAVVGAVEQDLELMRTPGPQGFGLRLKYFKGAVEGSPDTRLTVARRLQSWPVNLPPSMAIEAELAVQVAVVTIILDIIRVDPDACIPFPMAAQRAKDQGLISADYVVPGEDEPAEVLDGRRALILFVFQGPPPPSFGPSRWARLQS